MTASDKFLNQIICGDCLEVLKTIPDNSVDSIVTDPPYELGFMGKMWDSTGIAYNVEMWQECLRVLKHGGYLLAFGGTRTYHRMTCAIEDAGFEIRDCIQWIYGSGFPKSMDISKAIDKKFGAEREKIPNPLASKQTAQEAGKGLSGAKNAIDFIEPNAVTLEAKQYSGWGTALKPANEPIVVARKPLSEKTVAENVLKWGTGGINIDGCRIPTDELTPRENNNTVSLYKKGFEGVPKTIIPSALGRFPANVIFDEEAGKLLDEQSGDTERGFNDKGGASRFFYCAKASKKERGEGNNHPTVKPLSLMRYLVRLVTPPRGIVLDPYTGSGTTLIASKLEGFSYLGIEREQQYCEIARQRVEQAQMQQSLFC